MIETMHVPIFKGEGRLAYEDRPVPQPENPDDVLVKIEACGICGTDLNILATPPPTKPRPISSSATRGWGWWSELGRA